jgi:CO/xanthine dehydrogenase FAD-binding subunit
MRGNIPAYDLVSPKSLSEALKLLSEKPGFYKPFAGGTDLMVVLEAGSLKHQNFLNINRLKELRGIQETSQYFDIGACETYSDLQNHPGIARELPSLVQAGAETGGLAIQNRGTIGGNIANASPAADSPPALLSYDAQIKLISSKGERWLPYSEFHTGYKTMNIDPDEIIGAVRIPKPKSGTVHFYQKAGTRKAQAISKVVIAGTAVKSSGSINTIRIVVGSVAATTKQCHRTEDFLKGKKIDGKIIEDAISVMQTEISPLDDIRSTAEFRRAVAGNLLSKFLSSLR